MVSVPQRYVPKNLTKRDKKKQKRELKKSRRGYKKGKYYTRKKIKSFKSKISPHIKKAMKMYKVDKVRPSKKLAKATKCDIKGLRKIVKKGQGAYYSSGSRPNQTGHSWGYARLGSSITGGKASAVDYNVLKKYCKNNSRALKLAVKARKTYKKGLRRVKQVKMSGGGKRTKKNILPKLRPISYKNKKHKYKLKDPFTKRKKAIHEGVRMESKKTGKSTKDAAIAKKGRFNVLRIYRRYNNVKDCNKITKDMRYMDKKYGLGKTKNICGKK